MRGEEKKKEGGEGKKEGKIVRVVFCIMAKLSPAQARHGKHIIP